MRDLIERQAAIEVPERFIKDCNPEHFVGHQKFIEYMDDAEIGSFGNWQFANGFNMGLTAAEVSIEKLPSAQPEIIRCKDCKHFEYNHPYIIQGIPVLGHEVCNAWGDGCKTDENGYCFMAERRTDG